uniref:nestin n=1 Tax=Jaculus jaculus TaxID=51337 RepID=UPI001E1B36F8|nr:nestin [Jaculus jaculus]
MEGCVGEESFQMWELNRRLEAYLARVKALEEQNEGLSVELGGLRARAGDDASWRARADDELAALRALVEQRWREKHAAELERDRLAAELEGVAGRCERLRTARARTADEVARSRRQAEAETCARDWLGSRAAALERELDALRAAHEEDRADLHAQAARAPRRSPAPPPPPCRSPAPAPDLDQLARRLGDAWRGAVLGYQERVAHLETSLAQARERLAGAVQGAREGRLEVQQLGAERDGLRERRAALEQRLESCWQERLQATEKFQLAVESLEQEKQGLQSQIAQVLEGRQQLAHLKMSLSLEVATYRTLLEAENSRLQTPTGCSPAPLGLQDPKLQLHFPGTPEGRRLGPALPVLSPTPLPSPLPDTLETPMPAFLKSQEFLQAQPPTLASTPISPTPQASCPATNAELKAQGASLFLPQTQGGGRQPALEPPLAEAEVAVSDCVLPELKESGGKQPEASTGQFPEDQASLASPLNPDHPASEATDGIPGGPKMSSIFQEESEGRVLGPVEKEAAVEVKVANSPGQETGQTGRLDVEETQASQGPLGKDIRKAVAEESQEPPVCLETQTQETVGKTNHKSPSPLESKNVDILSSLEKEKELPMMSSAGRGVEERERPTSREAPELPVSMGRDHPQALPLLGKDNEQLLLSPETVSFLGKENQEAVRSTEEPPGALEKESQQQPRSLEAEDEETWRSLPEENQESLTALEDENQEIFRPPENENQEPPKSLEEDQRTERTPEREDQDSLRSPEEEMNLESRRSLKEEGQTIEGPLGKEDQDSWMPPQEDEMIEGLLEKDNLDSLRSLKEDQRIDRPLEKEDQESLSSPEDEIEGLSKKENLESLRSLKEEEQSFERPLEKENQQSLTSVEEGQASKRALEDSDKDSLRSLEDEMNLETLRSLKEENEMNERALEDSDKDSLRSLEDEAYLESLRPLKEEGQKSERPLEDSDKDSLRSLEDEMNLETLRSLKEEGQTSERALEDSDKNSLRSPEEENEMIEGLLQRENLESVRSLKEEDQKIERPLEKECQGSPKSLEEGQRTVKLLEHETQESLRSLDEEDQELRGSPEQDALHPLTAAKEEGWVASRPLQEWNSEPLKSHGKDQEMIKLLGKENQEESVEAVGSLETENLESLRTGGEETLELSKGLEVREPLCSLEEMHKGTVKPLEGEIQEPLGSGTDNHEMLGPPGKETQDLRSLDKWNVVMAQSPERPEKEQGQDVGVEEGRESPESPGSPEEEGQEPSHYANQLRWDGREAGQNPPLGRAGEGEDQAELDEGSRRGGKVEAVQEGERRPDALEEAWSLGDTESKEHGVLAEEAGGIGDAEGQTKQVETPGLQTAQGAPEVVKPPLEDEDVMKGGDQFSLEVTLRSDVARDQSVLGTGLRLDQEEVELREPGHPARGEVMQPPPEEDLQAEIAKGVEGPGRDPEGTGVPEAGLSELSRTSADPRELPKGWEEPRPEAPWGAEELRSVVTPGYESSDAAQPRSPGSEDREDAHLLPGPTGPRPIEPCSATPVLESAQPLAEGAQEAGWGLGGRAEAPGRVESEQKFGPVAISEGVQEEEESREESEADDLGETLPDSTPLGLYLKSPVSPKGDLAGDQRSPTHGEAQKEGWDPAVPASQDLGTPPSEEEEGEAEVDPASGLLEEFEDLENESSLPEVPREVASLGQLPPQLEPAGWDRDGESDGFADEEESGEEAEEEDEEAEPRGQWWGPRPSGSSLQALGSSQRGDFPEPEAVEVSGHWDDGLKDTAADISVAALGARTQDSAGPSGSEDESDSVSLDREDQVLDPLDTPMGAGDTCGLSGQGPNLAESGCVNGSVVNGLEQADGVGQGVTLGEDLGQGLPSQDEEGAVPKTPWVGSAVQLGQAQFLKFSPRAADGDSWSSGED